VPLKPSYLDIDSLREVLDLSEISITTLAKETAEPTTHAKFRGTSPSGEEWSIVALQAIRSIIREKRERLAKAAELLDTVERNATRNGELLKPIPRSTLRQMERRHEKELADALGL
jgi:hypothetical protein